MSKSRAYALVLQEAIHPDDQVWDYHIPDLPEPHATNAAGLVKCLSVVSSAAKQQITLRFEHAPQNRVTRDDVLDRFILVSFSDFRLQWPAISTDEAPRSGRGRENGGWITRMLVAGIRINGTTYHFFGHSNSQLKSRSCFMYAALKEEISAKIEGMGDLSKLKSVGKKAKRIGLLFSSAQVSLTLSPERSADIDDVADKDYIFTDGCGLMSTQFARLMAQRRNIVFRDRRYLPSVFQIRYRGYKGVLTLDSTLHGQIIVQFRRSMRKFKDLPDHSFAVVDYSKVPHPLILSEPLLAQQPYAFGSLNDEVVVLLHTVGITQEVLLAKQAQYLDFLKDASLGDTQAAFQFLSFVNRTDVAEKLLMDGMEAVRSTLQSLVKQEYARMINKRDEQRCRIMIPDSWLLFGVCNPTSKDGFSGRLKEGECFVRITQHGDGTARTIINTEVLVTRNLCLHPGDLQKFKAVAVPEFSHLIDCIVFSTRVFVTWDRDIIPRTMAEPANYPGGKELINFGEVTGDSCAEYFARYTNGSLGKVKNLYMKWARLGNPMSPECQQLNRLFSQSVDGNHIKIPENLKAFTKLEDPPEPRSSVAPFILDVLHDTCADLIRKSGKLKPEVHDDPDVLSVGRLSQARHPSML